MKPPFVWGAELPRLPGSQVELRALTVDDAPALLQIFGDPEVMRFWSSPAWTELGQATAFVDEVQAHFRERRLFQWGVSLPDTKQVIGTCTLFNLRLPHRRGELGFALRRDVWGQGLATDAIATLLRFCFEALDLHRVEADVDPQNARSLRMLERQGFLREGLMRERWHHLGQSMDGVSLGLLRRQWTGHAAARTSPIAGGSEPV
jgi:ribosomal-protein-alanine N-acetyltransferase